VRVTVQAAFGVAVAGLVAGQVPDDEGLVARAREKHVGAVAVSLVRAAICCVGVSNTHFSREVAREVTQPEWPSRVPRRTNCSAMFAMSGFC
jgi:hypothetical protein